MAWLEADRPGSSRLSRSSRERHWSSRATAPPPPTGLHRQQWIAPYVKRPVDKPLGHEGPGPTRPPCLRWWSASVPAGLRNRLTMP